MSAALTYNAYLHIEELLALQQPKSIGPEHDEMLFIIIHQVYELWFKELLHELDYLMALLRQADLHRALHTLRRMLTILKTVVSQIDILETMTPLEFNSFRGFLESASGFQSFQFRELEFALGYKRAGILHHFEGTPFIDRLQVRYEKPTLWDAFLEFLSGRGYTPPPDARSREVTAAISPSKEVQKLLLRIYREDAALSRLCERLVDLDEGLQEWRYRHVKMVERTIGAKKGTGGSPGAKYLHTTLKPFFPDLWAIRTDL